MIQEFISTSNPYLIKEVADTLTLSLPVPAHTVYTLIKKYESVDMAIFAVLTGMKLNRDPLTFDLNFLVEKAMEPYYDETVPQGSKEQVR